MADPVMVVNCGSAGGVTITDTNGIAAAMGVFDSANAALNQQALADYVDATQPNMQVANLTAADVIPGDAPDTGTSGD